MSDLVKSAESISDLIIQLRDKRSNIDSLLRMNNQLEVTIFDLQAENKHLLATIERLSNKNQELVEDSAMRNQQPPMYEVTFQSTSHRDVVLNLPFIPQKGNQFRLAEPLITVDGDNTNKWYLKVKSIDFNIGKDGKISNIEAWCPSN